MTIYKRDTKKTIKSILEEMKQTVEEGIIQTPSWWVDRGIELSALWQNLKDKLTESEVAYMRVVNEIQEREECSQAQAHTKAKCKEADGMNEYQLYKYLEGRDKILKQFIQLAKKRATIDNTYNY